MITIATLTLRQPSMTESRDGPPATAIDVPIYLVPDDKGALIGGMRFGYSSDMHDFDAGVFLDAPFSIFR